MHALYQLASYLLFGLMMPFLLLHPKLRGHVARRFGFYGASTPWPPSRAKGPRIWLHGASAGDLLALAPIIKELRATTKNATIIVSAMTNSGYAIARDRIASMVDGITYSPFDLPGATRRAVEAIVPDLLVLEYAELWPNLIHAAKQAGAKIALTNGRINERYVGRYRLLHFLFGNQLQKLDLLLMREEVEADRARLLGAPEHHVRVTGNTKFDNVSTPPEPERIEALRKVLDVKDVTDERLFVAGSTHEGEERSLFLCFRALRADDPQLRMVIAPRYVERAPRVAALARSVGLRVALRSQASQDASEAERAEVLVLDTMGELSSAYALASLVFVGGSFVRRGGQNILEPAGQGRPVLFGPYMMNFRDSVEILLGRGGIQVKTPEQLESVAKELLRRPDDLLRLGVMAKEGVQKVRGASRRNAELLLTLVS